jgi:hypothetical protein
VRGALLSVVNQGLIKFTNTAYLLFCDFAFAQKSSPG